MSTQFQPQRVTARRLRQRTSTHSIKSDDGDNLTVMVLQIVKPLFGKPPRKHLNQDSQKSDILVDGTPRNQPKHGETTTGFTPKHTQTHTHTQYDQKNGYADTQRTPWKTPEEATAGATQNRTGATSPSVPNLMRPRLLYWRDCVPPTRPFLLASNPVGTFRFNYNTNKIKVGPGVTQRARNTSLPGKNWPILLTEASGSYSWKETY